MAWRKVNLEVDGNLRCDISDEEIYVAVQDLKKQLGDAGVIIHKKTVPKPYNRSGVMVNKPISARRASSNVSYKERPSGRKHRTV